LKLLRFYIVLRYNQAEYEKGRIDQVITTRKTVSKAAPKRLPTQDDYEALSEFRYRIRCFLEFSQDAAKTVGLEPQQHQALLAIRGYPGGKPVAIGDLAERLRIKHHTAVGLIDRLVSARLVKRVTDPADHRRILLGLTRRAEEFLAELSAAHLDELSRIEPLLTQSFSRFSRSRRPA
jgi:DNA-binding MarR family transcriptional regulator